MKVLVTGAGGLIGYESVKFFLNLGDEVVGIDNNMRKYFFGDQGDTTGNIDYLNGMDGQFLNCEVDIRDRAAILDLFKTKGPFDLVRLAMRDMYQLKIKDNNELAKWLYSLVNEKW